MKPRTSEKKKGLLTNNEDPFSFFGNQNQPLKPGMGNMISVENRIREDVQTFFLLLTKFQRKNRSSANVMTYFLLFQSCHEIA